MPRSSNQKLKLLRIYNYLLEYTDGEHTVTAADIIKELERYGIPAERKSIYSDLEALADMVSTCRNQPTVGLSASANLTCRS